ncbi:MAG: hypothetical protein ACYC21_08765 [Eubacteriales bacterium]
MLASRLADYILKDELTDKHTDKVTNNDYPIFSNGQIGDVGTYYWEMTPSGKWQKFSYATQRLAATPLLKKLRPQYHPQ